MSWFFGKKKQKESPTDSSDETTTSSTGPSQPDDYIIIEKHGNPLAPMNPTSSTGNSLYPSFLSDGTINYQPVPSTIPQQINNNNNNNQIEQQNYLTGVPFKLSKQFDDDKNNEIEKLKIDEIISYFLRINENNYSYDFGLEESVINEMESTTE